jgi:hypothetical protein
MDIIIPVIKIINPGKGLKEKDCCGGGKTAGFTGFDGYVPVFRII